MWLEFKFRMSGRCIRHPQRVAVKWNETVGVRKRVVILLNSTVVALQQGQADRKENHYCPAWAGRRSELCVENCSSQCGLELSEKILLLASLVAELQEFEFCSGRAAGISVLH